MLYVHRTQANAFMGAADLRSVLDYIDLQRSTAAAAAALTNGQQATTTRVTRSHVPMLLKAAKTCAHPEFAVRLVQNFWPPPRTPPTQTHTPHDKSLFHNDKPWPREMEDCYAILTNCKPTPPWPVASPELLSHYLHFLSLHSYPLLPSMLLPALQLYKHHRAWQHIDQLLQQCMSQRLPIPRAAYPLFLIAMNHTRNHDQALLLLAHARANVSSSVALEQWYPIYHAAIDVMGVCGEDEKAMQIVQYMRDQGMQLTAITFTAAFNALGKAKHTATASVAYAQLQSLYAELKQRGLSLTQPLYRALIRAYMHFDQQDEAVELITHFMKVHHDSSTAFFMLSVSVEVENVEAAVLMLDKVAARRTSTRDDKWRIQLPLYNRVLELVVRQAQWDALRTVWSMRTALAVSANITSYYFLAQALHPTSRSWPALQPRVTELLHWQPGGHLNLYGAVGEGTVRATVWWAVKAAELGWGRGSGAAGSGLGVVVGVERRGEVIGVLDELGLSCEVGMGNEVRVSEMVLERWKRTKRLSALSAMRSKKRASPATGKPINGSDEGDQSLDSLVLGDGDDNAVVLPETEQLRQAAAQ